MTTMLVVDTALEAGLRDLRVVAPARVGVGALVVVGLADEYAAIETALGRAFVAWNGRGVSWVGQAPDGASFESRFRAEVGRDIRRTAALPARLARAVSRRLAGDRRVRIPLD